MPTIFYTPPVEQFIEIGKAVRPFIPATIRLVTNIGDFDLPTACRLEEAGFNNSIPDEMLE
jgi:hypothetical protein